jgi:hypothetical protein
MEEKGAHGRQLANQLGKVKEIRPTSKTQQRLLYPEVTSEVRDQ